MNKYRPLQQYPEKCEGQTVTAKKKFNPMLNEINQIRAQKLKAI